MHRTLLVVLVALAAIVLPAAAGDWWQEAGSPLDERSYDSDSHAAYRINWQDEYIEVMAGATVDSRTAVNQAHAVSMAKKTARHLAYEKLAETLSGLRITADATYDRELMMDSNLRTSLQALIRGAVVVDERVTDYPDGSVWAEVILGVHLNGDRGVGGALSKWIIPREHGKRYVVEPVAPGPETGKATTTDEGPDTSTGEQPAVAAAGTPSPEASSARYGERHTGLIIDARGLQARPAVFPRILDEKGNVVYGAGNVDARELARRGLVAYAADPEAARALDRVGKHPLVIRALRAVGERRSDLVISNDAVALIQATTKQRYLQKCRVVIVVD